MSSPPTAEPETKLDQIMAERREKAAKLRAAGSDPFRNDLGPTTSLAAVRAEYGKPRTPPPPDPANPRAIVPFDGKVLRVAGRLTAKRVMGKSAFLPIADTSGEIQLFGAKADIEQQLELLDVGDIVVAEGPAFVTKTEELSIQVKQLWIVTKSLRPLPSKEWKSEETGEARGGLTDLEARYRQRYVDFAVSPDVRGVFQKRTKIVRGIRNFLDARGYLEVETPMMHTIIGGAAARPFRTHHNTLDMDLYLRIAPELYLKRLVVGGFEKVFEINRNFRNEGLSQKHNPEFTMLEFYQAYATYTDLMDLTETMVTEVAQDVNGSLDVTWDGVAISLARPWRRLTIRAAVRELGGIANADAVFDDPILAAETCAAHDVPSADIVRILAERGGPIEPAALDAFVARWKAGEREAVARALVERYDQHKPELARITAGHLGYLVFEATAEAKLVQPTFLCEFPLAVSPLARKNDRDPVFCDRFELFVNGNEIANGFSELNDPDDQRARFQAQVAAKAAGAEETMDYDEDYCRALETGMPPTAGEGIGIDRLAMLLTGQSSIRDVILFPLMRPKHPDKVG